MPSNIHESEEQMRLEPDWLDSPPSDPDAPPGAEDREASERIRILRAQRKRGRDERDKRRANPESQKFLESARSLRDILMLSYQVPPIELTEEKIGELGREAGGIRDTMIRVGIPELYGAALRSFQNRGDSKRSVCRAWEIDKTDYQREQWAVAAAGLALAAGEDLFDFVFEESGVQATTKSFAKHLAIGAHQIMNKTPTGLESTDAQLASECQSVRLLAEYYWPSVDED